MSALVVLIIRHAEKPHEAWPGPGLTIDGSPDEKSLVVRGWQRAGAWAALLGADLNPDEYPKPSVIYAARPGDDQQAPADKQPSKRSLETVRPLADRLQLSPIVKWGQEDGERLVSEVAGLTGVVLICWEHKLIGSSIVPALLGNQTLPGVPAKWDSKRFDVVLRFDRAAPGASWSFRQLLPRLLAGDSDVPM